MLRTIVITVLLISANQSFACQCARGSGKNFLSQVKKFDYVVYGTFMREQPGKGGARLIVEEVYKRRHQTRHN